MPGGERGRAADEADELHARVLRVERLTQRDDGWRAEGDVHDGALGGSVLNDEGPVIGEW